MKLTKKQNEVFQSIINNGAVESNWNMMRALKDKGVISSFSVTNVKFYGSTPIHTFSAVVV